MNGVVVTYASSRALGCCASARVTAASASAREGAWVLVRWAADALRATGRRTAAAAEDEEDEDLQAVTERKGGGQKLRRNKAENTGVKRIFGGVWPRTLGNTWALGCTSILIQWSGKWEWAVGSGQWAVGSAWHAMWSAGAGGREAGETHDVHARCLSE